MSARELFLKKLKALRVHVDSQAKRRAVHKPLLLLYYLGRLQRGDERLVRYIELEDTIATALRRFGPARKQTHPEYPFWALNTDKLCEVKYRGQLTLKTNDHKPTRKSFVGCDAKGGLRVDDYYLLREDRDFQATVIHHILDEHFPSSLHEDVLRYFDLRLPVPSPASSAYPDEKHFRLNVIEAYENRCALSGFSVGAADKPGLEAVMLCWRQVGGEHAVNNGIAITTTYRKLFDLGIMSLDDTFRVIIANSVLSDKDSSTCLKALNGSSIQLPTDDKLKPALSNVRWHRKEVFKG